MKKYIEGFKELKKKPYGKAVIFFGGYLIFFLILALFSRLSLGNGGGKPLDGYESGISHDTLTLSALSDRNYNFSHVISLDNNTYTYEGKKEGSTETFMFNNELYSYRNSNYYKGEGIVESPYKYREFLVFTNLDYLIKDSYLYSKTSYEDGRLVYNYLLSTNTIDKYFSNINSDYDEVPNNLNVSIDSTNSIVEVNLVLNSYCKAHKECNEKLEIKQKYVGTVNGEK